MGVMQRCLWALTLVVIATLMGAPAMAVEEPPFHAVLTDGAFEVRDYPATVVAEVAVAGDQNAAASRGFRLLAAYIFGGNHNRKSIAMTAPVALQRTGEKIPMTAPVSQSRAEGSQSWVVRFTMPHAYALSNLPRPNDPQVQLRQIAPSRQAVLKFSGLATEGAVKVRTGELLAAAAAHHLKIIGPVTLAQYDPPWTLWFMRRNEVMAPIAP
jgi:hypothetical protein